MPAMMLWLQHRQWCWWCHGTANNDIANSNGAMTPKKLITMSDDGPNDSYDSDNNGDDNSGDS